MRSDMAGPGLPHLSQSGMGLVTSILARAKSDRVLHRRREAVAEEGLADSLHPNWTTVTVA